MREIETLLFDLGGVLVELTGIAGMMSWSNLDEEEISHRWMHSAAVRRFESGNCTAVDFCSEMVDEFSLSTSPENFRKAFQAWPVPYPGVCELLERLSTKFRMVCLSNTNHLHWERFTTESELLSHFHITLPSHITGKMKPDPEVYYHALDVLGVHPNSIFFMDDNQLNIDAALAVGIQAELTRSPSGVIENLNEKGLLAGVDMDEKSTSS
ncbi:MAG: hypothetical protein CMQ20_05205 [Gammaproteobacteria bacterium]|jgi:putative hydrolase of the HAD superfamily|nr:hypothetical protein [Gammaproteobacteria bacterium]|tara:strand:- start:4358 stop:4990 length:633 start_codon:yes stop_codon:yes gene_type:complete